MTINEKNATAVSQTLRSMDAQIREQQQKIDSLHGTVSQLMRRLEEMNTMVQILQVQAAGKGPTVR